MHTTGYEWHLEFLKSVHIFSLLPTINAFSNLIKTVDKLHIKQYVKLILII